MALATAACANGAPALAPNSLRWTLRLVRRLPGQSVRPSSNSIAQLPLPISRLLHLPNSKQLIVAARVALLAQRLGALRFLIRCRTSSPRTRFVLGQHSPSRVFRCPYDDYR